MFLKIQTMQLTKNEKIVVGVSAVLLTGVIVFLIVKKKDNSGASDDPTGNNGNGSNQVPFNALSIADSLHNAMKDIGTDESAIFNALQGVNASQFVEVVTAFGLRKYNSWLGNDVGGSVQPLKVWLSEELSTDEYKTLKLKYTNSL
jgi:hypothetical protein